jgi:hypothetical protein
LRICRSRAASSAGNSYVTLARATIHYTNPYSEHQLERGCKTPEHLLLRRCLRRDIPSPPGGPGERPPDALPGHSPDAPPDVPGIHHPRHCPGHSRGRSPEHCPGHLGNALGRHGPGSLEDTEGSAGGSAQPRCESHGRTRAQALFGTVSSLFCPTSGPNQARNTGSTPQFSLFQDALRDSSQPRSEPVSPDSSGLEAHAAGPYRLPPRTTITLCQRRRHRPRDRSCPPFDIRDSSLVIPSLPAGVHFLTTEPPRSHPARLVITR